MAKERSGLVIGLNRGHVRIHYSGVLARGSTNRLWVGGINWLTFESARQKTERRDVKPRISRTKGHLSKRTAFVREIVKEVSGYVRRGSPPKAQHPSHKSPVSKQLHPL